MLKKLSVTLFILSVTVSGVFASSFWQSLFGQNQSVFVDTVGFSSGNPQFDENVGNAVFTVTRSGDVGGAFSVDYATSDHQAIAPDDYTATSGILNFADGETSKQFSVPIIDDSIGEDLEFFAVTLSNPSNGVQIGNGSVFALIISDDMYFFNINQNSIESNEVFFNVERYGGNLNTTSTVSFATSDGTAIAGVDYIAQTGTLTFGPNETSKTITITYIDDVIIEPDETFFVTLSNSSAGIAIIGNNPATVTIIDNDQQEVSIGNANSGNNVIEGNDAIFNVVRQNGDLTQPLSVNFTTADGTATAGSDYTAKTGTVTFAANDVLKTITVATINDLVTEGDEGFSVIISNPTNGVIISNATGSATLVDNTPTERLAYAENSGITDIFAVNDNGSDFANLTDTEDDSEGQINVNKFNGKFVFSCNGNLCAMNSDGSNRTTLYDDPTYELHNPNWSADGQIISFSADNNVGVYIVATGQRFLRPVGVLVENPKFSPDGTKILFEKRPSVSGNNLYIINPDGTNLTNLTNSSGEKRNASWSPDGTKIIFDSREIIGGAHEPSDIFTINADGTSLTNLTDSETVFDETPDFSPDGTKIAFSSDLTVTVMNANGTSPEELQAGKQPKWSPSGTKIAFVTDDSNGYLKAMKANGTLLSVNQFSGTGFDKSSPIWLPEQPSAVGFEIVNSSVSEGGSTANITVTRTGNANSAFSVNFATANGTAISGSDYTATTNGTLNFASSETQKTISVPIIDDVDVEDTEDFTVTLTNPTNGTTLSNANHTVSITDNEPTVNFTLNTSTVTEGGSITATFTRTDGSLANPSSVVFRATGGSATSGADYTPVNETVTFAAGESTKTFIVQTIDDNLGENAETLEVEILSPVACRLGSPTQLVITINDNEPTVSFTLNSSTVTEGDSITATITRTGILANPSSVVFLTLGGTATSGADYTPVNETVTFAAGESTKTVIVQTIDDSLVEDVESLVVEIQSPVGCGLGSPTQLSITINDNEPTVDFTLNTSPVTEGGIVTATFTRTNGSLGNPSSVVFRTTAIGNATSGTDYTPVNETVTFAAGESTKTFIVQTIDDSLGEGVESFIVEIQSPVGCRLGSSTGFFITINDNEPTVRLTLDSWIVTEGDSITATITRTKQLNGNLALASSVNIATVNGDATGGSDYTSVNETVSFAAGETTKTIIIQTIADDLLEGVNGFPEYFNVKIQSPSTDCTLGSSTEHDVAIINDESIFSIDSASRLQAVNENVGSVNIVVKRRRSLSQSVSVNYSTIDATALVPSDYTAVSGTLTFLSGEDTKTVSIPIVADSISEPREFFRFRLSNTSNGSILSGLAEARIRINGSGNIGISARRAILTASGSSDDVFYFPDAGLPGTPNYSVLESSINFAPHSSGYLQPDKALVSYYGHNDSSAVGGLDVVNLSTGAIESSLRIPTGIIAVSPNSTKALISRGIYDYSNVLYVMNAPFNAPPQSSLELPGDIVSSQKQVIVFSSSGRAFVYNRAGISVIDPPYTAINFTIPTSDNFYSGAIAISPDGNTLLVTSGHDYVSIYHAPFSALSVRQILTIPASAFLNGIMVAPNGQKAIVVDYLNNKAWAISAPFTGDFASTVEEIPLPANSHPNEGFGDVGISADSQVAIITGGDTNYGYESPPVLIKAPFGATSQTSTIQLDSLNPGRGAGSVRFLPPALTPTAADVSLSGRLTTANGRGIRNASVTVTDMQNSEVKRTITGAFGYYAFNELEAGRSYVITIQSRRFRFDPSSRVITLTDDLTGEDFVSIE